MAGLGRFRRACGPPEPPQVWFGVLAGGIGRPAPQTPTCLWPDSDAFAIKPRASVYSRQYSAVEESYARRSYLNLRARPSAIRPGLAGSMAKGRWRLRHLPRSGGALVYA